MVASGKPYETQWSCGGTKRIEEGDFFFLIRLGSTPKGIVGCGTILSSPTALPHWNSDLASEGKTALYTEVTFAALSEEPFIDIDELKEEFPDYHWTPQGSGNVLPANIAGSLLSKIENTTGKKIAGLGGWSKGELRASVAAYLEMLRAEQKGQKYVKKRFYESLSEEYGRTASAYEYRMQNISYVLSLMGRSWIDGLKPKKNVGHKVGEILESLLLEAEGIGRQPVVASEIRMLEKISNGEKKIPAGSSKPQQTTASTTIFARDESVKSWVLKNANGVCECCDRKAPFTKTNGLPFLEIHHVRKLADGGSDKVENAVALCPNCHREFHFGIDAMRLANTLYRKIARLRR